MANYHTGRYKEKKQFLLDCIAMMTYSQRLLFVKQIKNSRAEHVLKERLGFYAPQGATPTLADLGRMFCITRSRVHQIERYAIDKALSLLASIDWVVPTDTFFDFVKQGLKRINNH
jgi:hypothetical protein